MIVTILKFVATCYCNLRLFSEERHEIEVRLKDGWSIYKIAKHLQRPYNTIKNEVNRGTVQTDDGQNKRYSADKGEQVYKDNCKNSRRQYNCLKAVKFLTYVVEKFQGDEKWSLDAAHGAALKEENSSEMRWYVQRHCITTLTLVCSR